jgi:putative MATE family efflux protein
MPMGRLLVRIAVPASVAMIVNSIYNLTDTFFVGRGVGPVGMGALALIFPFQLMVMAVGSLMGIGGASVISRALGAGDEARARSVLGSIISTTAIVGVVVAIVGSAMPVRIARLLGAEGELLEPTVEYLRVILLAEPFFILHFAGNNLVRAEGQARRSMVALICGVGLNIILDPIFIMVFDWGIAGAAIATLLAHILNTAVLADFYLRRTGAIKLSLRDLRPRINRLGEVFAVGSSGAVRQLSTGIMFTLRNLLLVGVAGATAVSAYGVVFRVILILALPAMGLAQSVPPVVGYNYGAGNMDRVRQAVRIAMIVSTVLLLVGLALMVLFPGFLLGIFSNDSEYIATGVPIMRVAATGMLVFPSYFIGTAFYQAIGRSMLALVLAMTRPVVGVLVMLWGVNAMGAIGVVIADPIALAAGSLTVILSLSWAFRRDDKLSAREPIPVVE